MSSPRPPFLLVLPALLMTASSCTGSAPHTDGQAAGARSVAEDKRPDAHVPDANAGRGPTHVVPPNQTAAADAATVHAHDASTSPEAGDEDASTEGGRQNATAGSGGSSAMPHDAGAPYERDASVQPRDAALADANTNVMLDASAVAGCQGPPGLYKGTRCGELSDGVQPYHPRFPLWSDGATKDRFVYLPPGMHIDTSNPDRWAFPVGTRLYKTFALGELKVETRLVEKVSSGTGYNAWKVVTYAWSADQNSVTVANPNGVVNALGTQFDIPAQLHCQNCHAMNGADAAIGFNAIQLNHADDGVNLRGLIADGRLVNERDTAHPNVDVGNALILGDATTQAALGYLHGNCGHCHGGPNPRANQLLWSTVGTTELKDLPIFRTAVCQCLVSWTGRSNADGAPYELRVAPSHEALSGIVGRMSASVAGERMPPVGTKLVDEAGLASIKRWIASLDPATCEGPMLVCPP